MVAAVAERSSGRVRVRVIFMVMVTIQIQCCSFDIGFGFSVFGLWRLLVPMAGNASMVPLVHLNWSCFLATENRLYCSSYVENFEYDLINSNLNLNHSNFSVQII